MKTTNGLPCNETRFTPKSGRSRITYRFVTGDSDIPASCTVQLGSTDPATGETISDVDFFREYYRIVDCQVHRNLKAMRPEYTREEQERRKAEKQAFTAAFLSDHGYPPTRDDIAWHMAQKEKSRYYFYLEEITNDEGEENADKNTELGYTDEDPFGTDLPDDLYALREFAATLTGRRRAVYDAMLDNLAGGAGKTSNVELARFWGVSEGQIRKDQKMIMKMIKEKLTK